MESNQKDGWLLTDGASWRHDNGWGGCAKQTNQDAQTHNTNTQQTGGKEGTEKKQNKNKTKRNQSQNE